MKRMVVFGCGGHEKVVRDVISSKSDFEIYCYFDNAPKNGMYADKPTFSSLEELRLFAEAHNVKDAVIAIGNNESRKKLYHAAKDLGLNLPAIVDSSAKLSPSCKIGQGTVVMPLAVINADARINSGVIINTSAVIEHDCTVESFVHIAPGSILCGNVSVGELTLFGARSVAIPGISIGRNSMLGAGSVIVRNIPDNCRAFGNPARIL